MIEAAINTLGVQIDEASHPINAEILGQLDNRCAELLLACDETQAAIIWYFRANIQAALQDSDDPRSWNWRQPHRERQILYLRRARTRTGFKNLDPFRRAQITTNLANNLSAFGRSVEAISLYDSALKIQPFFAMALGNRGLARMEFARALHDRGHAAVILLDAHNDLLAAASSRAIWDSDYPGVREQFVVKAAEIAVIIDIAAVRSVEKIEGHSLGRSKREKAYRQWALANQLFLNPMNVLGAHPIAATDRFNLPEYRSPIDDPPRFISWFNQLKQEYAAARFLLFKSQEGGSNHFADRELMLIDTLDYPAFGLAVEKMRLAFRTAYSLLDKVAGFINAYFEIGDQPDKVNLRNVWLTKDRRSVRPEFDQRKNLPLRGLYWLAFDIVGKATVPDTIEPEASELYRLRNALEHRCLVINEFSPALRDHVIETSTLDAFSHHTLMMLRLARAALLYLSLAVRQEERERAGSRKALALGRLLPTYSRRRSSRNR